MLYQYGHLTLQQFYWIEVFHKHFRSIVSITAEVTIRPAAWVHLLL